MLNHWKLGQDLCVVHLDHPLVDLSPAIFDPRDVEQHWAVLPKGPLFDIIDECNCREIHVGGLLLLNEIGFGDGRGVWGVWK